MKEIIKASVAGYSFTFEKEAHQFLENYFHEVQNHFAEKEEGKEIAEDIEERISELLRMDVGEKDKVVSLSDVQHLVEIMGKPSEMVDEEDGFKTQDSKAAKESSKSEKKTFQKRVYRDEDSAILGGVFSGLANYFQTDRVFLRVGYVILLILGFNFWDDLATSFILAYVVAWIVIPKATTIKEKLAMSGKDPSIADIEIGNSKSLIRPVSNAGKALGKILKIFFAVVLALTVVGMVAGLVFGFFFPSVFDMPSIVDLLKITDFYSSNIVWVICLVAILPIVLLLHTVIRLFGGFRNKDGVILGVIFVIWIGLCAYLGVVGVKYAENYRAFAKDTKEYAVNSPSDTVYVRLADRYENSTSVVWNSDDYNYRHRRHHHRHDGSFRKMEWAQSSWFFVPPIDLKEDTTVTQVQVQIQRKAFDKSRYLAKERLAKTISNVVVKDSLILLSPEVYSLESHWDRNIVRVKVVYPKGKTVLLGDMLKNVEERNWGWNFDWDD